MNEASIQHLEFLQLLIISLINEQEPFITG